MIGNYVISGALIGAIYTFIAWAMYAKSGKAKLVYPNPLDMAAAALIDLVFFMVCCAAIFAVAGWLIGKIKK